MSLLETVKKVIDTMPPPVPRLARSIYHGLRGAHAYHDLRGAHAQPAEPLVPEPKLYVASPPPTLSPIKPSLRPGSFRFVDTTGGSPLAKLEASLLASLPDSSKIALIGDDPGVATLAEHLTGQRPNLECLVLREFNQMFDLRSRRDVLTAVMLCREDSFMKYLRGVVHAARFEGDLIIPANADSVYPNLEFENPRPIVHIAYPCAGTNRFAPSFLKLLETCKWENFWFSPFMRNVHSIQQASDLHETIADRIERADHAIYWRARALDHAQCMTVHEWVSLRRLANLDCSFVVLMRDPRDILNSYFWHTRPETELSDEQHLLRILEGYTRFHDSEPAYAFPWPDIANLIDSYVVATESPNMYIVRFEDLHIDTLAALKSLMQHLGLDPNPFAVLDDEAYQAAAYLGTFEYQTGGQRKRGEDHKGRPGGEHSGISARKGIVGDWRSSFTSAVVERFKELAGDALIRLGYEENNDWHL